LFPAGELIRRLTAAAAKATAAAISRLTRMPYAKVARLASSAPNTATASVPPTWRLVLNAAGYPGPTAWNGVQQQRHHRRHDERPGQPWQHHQHRQDGHRHQGGQQPDDYQPGRHC
jgi:hypothetical protein